MTHHLTALPHQLFNFLKSLTNVSLNKFFLSNKILQKREGVKESERVRESEREEVAEIKSGQIV